MSKKRAASAAATLLLTSPSMDIGRLRSMEDFALFVHLWRSKADEIPKFPTYDPPP